MRLNPAYWLDRAFDPATEWTMRREALGVTEGMEGLQRVYRWVPVRFTVGIALLMLYDYLPEPADSLGFAALGGIVAYSCMTGFARARAYQRGWLEGRKRMAANLSKHVADRGGFDRVVDASNWLDAEYNHDMVHVLGLPPTAPPTD